MLPNELLAGKLPGVGVYSHVFQLTRACATRMLKQHAVKAQAVAFVTSSFSSMCGFAFAHGHNSIVRVFGLLACSLDVRVFSCDSLSTLALADTIVHGAWRHGIVAQRWAPLVQAIFRVRRLQGYFHNIGIRMAPGSTITPASGVGELSCRHEEEVLLGLACLAEKLPSRARTQQGGNGFSAHLPQHAGLASQQWGFEPQLWWA